MAYLELSQGKQALIDDEDFEWLNQWKWSYAGGYAQAYMGGGRKNPIKMQLHRYIMCTPEGMSTDHINGDGLDNRKSNLRICTHKQNMYNVGARRPRNRPGKYVGVEQLPGGSWRARIRPDKRNIHIGCYITEEEAAEAYNRAAIKYYGSFAKLNEVKT